MEKDKYKAKYASKDEIPAELQAIPELYVSRNGQWEFDGPGFTDLDGLLNPGLAANRDKLRVEKEDAATALKTAQAEKTEAERKLADIQKPGTKIINETEANQLAEYQKLGAPKDLKAALDENGTLKGNQEKLTRNDEIKAVCDATGLNTEAAIDLLDGRLANAKLIAKDGKVPDPKNPKKQIDGKLAYVEVTTEVGGKQKVEEFELTKYVKDQKIPDYLVTGLFSGQSSVVKTAAATKSGQPNVPDLSTGASNNTAEEGTKPMIKQRIERMKAETSTRQKPWSKPPATT